MTQKVKLTSSTTEQARALRDLIVNTSVNTGIEYIKANGLYKSEEMLDRRGEKIYTAKAVGYKNADNKGPAEIAIEYEFKQDYADNLYFDYRITADSKRILQETFNGNGRVTNTIVYTAGSKQVNINEPKGNEYTTDSGLKIITDGITLGYVERVTEFTDNKDGTRSAKSVVFGKDKNPTYFVDGKICDVAEYGQHITVSKRYDLSNASVDPNEKVDPNAPAATEEQKRAKKALDAFVGQYADVLASVDSMKIQGRSETTRSEERRVGKECRSRWSPYH